MTEARQIAVIGAGLMGHGIALALADAGHEVRLTDPSSDARDSAPDRIAVSHRLMGASDDEIERTVGRVETCATVEATVADAGFVFEAAPERLELKQALFAEIEVHAPPDAVLASNTSVIRISSIMERVSARHRALGTHWWNPPHMLPLVEIVKTRWTSSNAADSMFALLESSGKSPVMVERDVPGFIGNRLQHALWREAIALVEKGICTAEAIDTVVKGSFGRRLAVLGPMENADLVGIELTQAIHGQLLFDLDRSDSPSPRLQSLIDEGRTGMAAGAGFRKWEEGDLDATKRRMALHLRKLDAILNQE